MNTTNFHPSSEFSTTPQTGLLHMVLIEPLLVVATAAFWLLALPFVAVSLGCVKIWDSVLALNSSKCATPNPLILRDRRRSQDAPAFSSPSEIWASSHI